MKNVSQNEYDKYLNVPILQYPLPSLKLLCLILRIHVAMIEMNNMGYTM
jgi:hypothetical protein